MTGFTPTESQISAIQVPIGFPIVVSAAAGTGKTSVLSLTVAGKIVAEKKTPVTDILVLTFTRKAAAEMSERIESTLLDIAKGTENPADRKWLLKNAADVQHAAIETIDAFAQRILREYSPSSGLDPSFELLDDAGIYSLGRRVAKNCFLKWETDPPHPLWGKFVSETNLVEWEDKFIELVNSISSRGNLTSGLVLLGKDHADVGDLEHAEKILSDKLRVDLEKSCVDILSILDEIEPGLENIFNTEVKGKTPQYIALSREIHSDFPDLRNWLKNKKRKIDDPVVRKAASWTLWTNSGPDERKFTHGQVAALKELMKCVPGIIDSPVGILIDVKRISIYTALASALIEFDRAFFDARIRDDRLTFADCQYLARKLLSDNPPILDKVREKYKYVVIDEYQDINPVQQDFILTVCRTPGSGKEFPGNLYIVGDERQSIYGFRNADYTLLRDFRELAEKIDRPGGGSRILYDSFRSRPEIVDLVNHTFMTAWSDGDLHADLVAAFDRYGSTDDLAGEGNIEFHVVGCEQLIDGRAREASIIAERIADLVRTEKKPIWKKSPAGIVLGNLKFSDCAVLLRSSTNFHLFDEKFAKRGIPCNVEGGGGFWGLPELADIKALVNMLSSRRIDLDTAVFLRSPWVGISDDGLLEIANSRDKNETWLDAANKTEFSNDADRDRYSHFYNWYENVSAQSGDYPAADLIRRAFIDSGYSERCLAEHDGDNVHARIENFIAMLWNSEKPYDINHTAAHMNILFDRKISHRSPVSSTGEDLGAVTIGTIHQAKGREWHLVALPDLQASPPRNSRKEQIVWTDEYGINSRWWNHLTGEKMKSSRFYRALKEIDRFNDSEEIRKFYVAMTRAREHLILSSALKIKATQKEPVPRYDIRQSSGEDSFTNWLWLLLDAFDGQEIDLVGGPEDTGSETSLNFRVHEADPHRKKGDIKSVPDKILTITRFTHGADSRDIASSGGLKDIDLDEFRAEMARIIVPPEKNSNQYIYSVTDIVNFKSCPLMYQYRSILNVPPQMSSAIFTDTESTDTESQPAETLDLPASDWGNIFHRILERCGLDKNPDKLTEIIMEELYVRNIDPASPVPEKLRGGKFVGTSFIDYIRTTIEAVLNLDIFKGIGEMLDPGIFRELSLTGKIGTTNAVIRGSIDLLTDSSEKIIIADYKSGKYDPADPDTKALIYKLQLALYKYLAMSRFQVDADKVETHIIFINPPCDIPVPVSDGDMNEAVEIINSLEESTHRNSFDPLPSEKTCSYCDYSDICPHSFFKPQNSSSA
ncbi:MAG TPA: UvrD-helicase domain-containing protein [bacterium]